MGRVLEAMNKSQVEKAAEPGAGKVTAAAAPRRKPRPVLDAEAARYSNALAVWRGRDEKICEQYRALRTHLLAHYKDKPFALIVTSARRGEGKTVTCLNLAFSLSAVRECHTVVVDCDFRKASVAALLGHNGHRGLADVLRGAAAPDDVIQPTTYPNVSVILSGKTPAAEVGGLLSRPELDDLVQHLRRHYDYVLFDTPPVNVLSDAGAVGRAAGEALMVVRMNKTRRESVQAAVRCLERLRVRVAGLVLTGQKYYIPGCLYHYS